MTMMLQFIIVLTISSIVTINGVLVRSHDILAAAHTSANQANFHQLSLALELYYADHQSYPEATNGNELITTLYKEGYISGKLLQPEAFEYVSHKNSYHLDLKNN